MQTKHLCVLIHDLDPSMCLGAPLNRFKPPVKYFTDRSKAVLLVCIFLCFFCLVFAMPLYASVYMCLVVTCCERTDLLALVCDV